MARFSVRAVLGLVAVVALGLAAMSDGSEIAEDLILAVTVLSLSIVTVGAMVRPSPAAAWRGFATFGWVYFLLFQVARFDPEPGVYDFVLPTQPLLEAAMPALHPVPNRPTEPQFVTQHPHYQPNNEFQYTTYPLVFQDTKQQNLYDQFATSMADYIDRASRQSFRIQYASVIGHYCLALLFALLGSIAGELLAGRRGGRLRASP